MTTKPCKCCEDKKPDAKGGQAGYGYNPLEGKAHEWAANHQLARSEYCVPVNGGRRFGGPVWQKIKCGNGRMGFSTRRRNQDGVQMERGLDGQLKGKRRTLVNKRSARTVVGRRARRIDGSKVGLISSAIIAEAQRDPAVVANQEIAYQRMRQREHYRRINRSKLRRATKRVRKTR